MCVPPPIAARSAQAGSPSQSPFGPDDEIGMLFHERHEFVVATDVPNVEISSPDGLDLLIERAAVALARGGRVLDCLLQPLTVAFDAGKIASLETFTKIALFYVHERIWRLFPWGADSHARSFIKAVSWRLVGSADTFLLSLLITGKLKYAVSIATAEAITKIVLYYLHERAWRLVPWGRLEGQSQAQPAGAAAH